MNLLLPKTTATMSAEKDMRKPPLHEGSGDGLNKSALCPHAFLFSHSDGGEPLLPSFLFLEGG
jgi:hypothetical protein